MTTETAGNVANNPEAAENPQAAALAVWEQKELPLLQALWHHDLAFDLSASSCGAKSRERCWCALFGCASESIEGLDAMVVSNPIIPLQ